MIRQVIRTARRVLVYTALIGLMLFLFQYSTYPIGLQWNAVSLIASPYQFDYLAWEMDAIAGKVDQTLYGVHPFMTEADRSQYVRDYMSDLQQAQSFEAQIGQLYTDPTVSNPEIETAILRDQRDQLRANLQDRQSLVEAILEGQVAAVLVEQGFEWLGQLLPPISAHFTQVPNLLVVSPRDKIRFDISINLRPITVDRIAALENRIDSSQNVSSLIVPLGGIALYPAMVLETTSIPWALDTIAHEWLHHYLFAFPLGLSYFNGESFAGDTRIINETTASLFGQEISRLALARYYPNLLPPDVLPPSSDVPLPPPAPPPTFDFGKEMDITRRIVDNLLLESRVDEAEAYMETRRQEFVANGYLIRKLNQAYFAFYGGYQAGDTSGAGGADPIGPTIRAIRDSSATLQMWVVTMRGITSREALTAAVEAMQVNLE